MYFGTPGLLLYRLVQLKCIKIDQTSRKIQKQDEKDQSHDDTDRTKTNEQTARVQMIHNQTRLHQTLKCI